MAVRIDSSNPAGVQNVTAMSGLPPNRPVLANDTNFEWIPSAL